MNGVRANDDEDHSGGSGLKEEVSAEGVDGGEVGEWRGGRSLRESREEG